MHKRKKHALIIFGLLLFLLLVPFLFPALAASGSVHDYVSSNDSDVDLSPDRGTHLNFTAQTFGPDSVYDTLVEENMGGLGASWWFNASDSEISFSNTAYNEKHRLEFVAQTQGDYLIIVAFAAAGGSTSYSVGFRAQLDDSTTFMEGLVEPVAARGSGDYRSFGSFVLAQSLSQGSHHVDLDAFGESNGYIYYMRYMQITILRLDDWLPTSGMYEYASTDGEASLPGGEGQYIDAQTMTFTPDQAGDYLVLASLELYCGAVRDSVSARLNYDNGLEYLPVDNIEETYENYATYESKDTTDYLPWVWGGIVNIPASSKTIRLQACRTGGTNTAGRVRRSRILAIRLNAMDPSALYAEDTSVTATSSQWTDKSTITFTPPSQDEYLIFGATVIKPDSTSYPGHARLEHVSGTNPETIALAEIDSKDAGGPADCIPFLTAEIKSLDAIPQTFKTQYGRVLGSGTIYGKGSFIAIIQKPLNPNYELDLEVQWTNATYELPNEELCIYGGTMGLEGLLVDVWDGVSWQNLFTSLSSGWNNASVTSYLTSSTLTIRFIGATETADTTQDSWQIDATLLYSWTNAPVANFSYTPATPLTNETITFNASDSYDPDGTIVSYSWDFGDGANSTGETATHAYGADGIYNVTLTVTDNHNSTDTESRSITVLNRSPVASFTESATSVPTGTPITFNASDSYDPDGTIVSYFWSFGDGFNTTGIITGHAYADDGNYTVALIVTDDDGATDTATATKTVLNRSPIAAFTESAETVHTSEVITFNASDSYDPDGTIVSYFWDFGDGTNDTGLVVNHAYADDGNYTVALIVTDDDGATDTATATKTVLNRSPIAAFTESAETVFTDEVIYFNASNSYDPDGTVVSFFWDFGDGSNSTGVATQHFYGDNGTYIVTLTVTDDDGATNATSSVKTVLNRPPVALFTESAETVLTGEAIFFNASDSYDPDGTIVSYFWSFGDGFNATGVTVSHAYADDGTYSVTLTVTDNDSETASSNATKTVLNRPPVASFTESAETVYTSEVIDFNASASSDQDGSVASYEWNFGDGNTTTTLTPIVTHFYGDNGTYIVTLTVTDDDGATNATSSVKTVLNRSPVASFTFSPLTPHTDEAITFDASTSYDTDGAVISYSWNFGDGNITTITAPTVTHSFADNSTYQVTLTITDDDNAVDTTSQNITILNRSPIAAFTESAETVFTDEVIYFNASSSYDSDGSIVSYFWDFGDGSNATGVTATHAYVDDGSYVVTLTVTDDDGATAAANATKTVLNQPPIASFTESASTVLTGETISFNASASYDSDGSIVSYFWDFGDGSNATGVTATHAYADDGSYTVILTVTDNDNTAASSNATKTVLNRPPVAIFTESAETVLTNELIYFNASDSYDVDGSIISFFWDFGDGSNVTGLAVSHAYTDNGTYTVTLSTTDDDGATDTATATKTVLNRPPVAIFTESAETAYVGESITFNASSSYDSDGSIVSYFWDFGDGSNATGIIVGHAYSTNGTYIVTLTVTDDDGASNSTSSTKTILRNEPPVASFTESAETVYTGETIYFNATGSYDPDGTIVSYFWSFGDGFNATGVTVNHAYVDDGYYFVNLTVTDDRGATSTSNATKTVLNRSPIASFTESASVVYTGETITFNASSSYDPDGAIVSYQWDFGDGANATGIMVTHAYSDDGAYDVTLTVTDDDGAATSTNATKTVLNQSPVAIFTESAETVFTDEVIYFNASSSYDSDGSIVSYFWDFGDGSNATGVTATHAYVDDGSYVVTLTVTDDDGATGAATANKTVLNRLPVALFAENATTVLTGETIHFDASTSYDTDGIIISYSWDFGDGTNTTGMIVDHTYLDNGTYTVTLTVVDDDGATDSETAIKTVLNRLPVAVFTESAETVYTNEPIAFNASDSYDPDGNVAVHFWNFGDGANATGVTVSHAYADDGVYIVTLIVTDDDGATATANATKTVLNRSPIASFTESASVVYTGEAITFNASDSFDPDGVIVNYFWAFGDGANATGTFVTHAYANDGNYTVILTITDDDGASDTANATKTVFNRAPSSTFSYTPTYPIAGDTVTFNASSSYDSDGSIISYQWSFGDGSPLLNTTTAITTHNYGTYGNYTVILTVTDDNGDANSTTQIVGVRDYPTAIFIFSPSSPSEGETVVFNSSSSLSNGGVITSYLWDFGDGTPSVNTTTPTTTHTYSAFGNYTAILTVADSEGLADTTTNSISVRGYPTATFTFTPSYPIEGEIITFDASTSTPNGGVITSYQWNFGDGNITTVATSTITHAYSAIGNYTVTLTIVDSEGLGDSESRIVSVRGYPLATFSNTPGTPYVGDIILFNASLSSPNGGVIVGYLWDFDDGSPLFNTTNSVTTRVYNLAGNYTVTLTVTDSEGLNDTQALLIVVAKAPIAVFTYSPAFPKVDETVTFNASSSYDPNGFVANYTWNFGDGNITTTTNPTITHAYSTTGAYTVILTITDNDGYTDVAASPLTLGTPQASFAYSPGNPIAEQLIAFNASSSYDPNGYIVSYVWNFGDGNITTVTQPAVTHSYVVSGNYTVSLTVADNQGLTDTTSHIVSVGKSPVAFFTYAPSVLYVGDIATFDASLSTPGSGNITYYLWNFGDGSPLLNSTNPVATHIYTAASNYIVDLTIQDSGGLTNTEIKLIPVLQSPIASFIFSPTYPQAFETVTFNATESLDTNGYIVSYVWNFGDGNITTVTQPTVTHIYIGAGNYTVILTVADDEGFTHTTTQNLYVSTRPPIAHFTRTPASPLANQSVTFNATDSFDLDGTIVSYQWDFGDGNTTTLATPIATHRYFAAGNYTVRLTVTDNDNLNDTITGFAQIRDYPSAVFTYAPPIPDVDGTVNFDASSSTPNGGIIVSFSWDFGDGSPVLNTTNPDTTHAFAASGNYTVTLTVTDSEGLSGTASQVVYVADRPNALFTYSPTSPYVGDTVTFNATQSYDLDGVITSYLWNFADGSPEVNSTTPVTTHVYSVGGNYSVTLTVFDNLGFNDTATQSIAVGKAPEAAFTYSPSFPIAMEVVTFNASTSNDIRRSITSYTWNFGDGNITTTATPVLTYIYSQEGTYAVFLTVTDTGGYNDTANQNINIRNYPDASFSYAPSYPIRGQGTTFDATASQARGGIITSYLWDFGDGTPAINTTNAVITHTYAVIGQYDVTLTIADSEGLSNTTARTLKVRDFPTADFTWSPSIPVSTQPVTFNASMSTANSGNITGFLWDFGDGTISTMPGNVPTKEHTYSVAMNYTVTLTVYNTEGLQSSTSKTVMVAGAPPVAFFDHTPPTPIEGQEVTFNASSSYDPDGLIVSYWWDFGDGNITSATTPIIIHVYANAGNFTVALTVTDSAGLNATTAKTLKITAYPVASFTWTPLAPQSTEPVTFNASASIPNSGFIASYVWNFGDGNTTTATTPIATHVFPKANSYTVTLTVINSDGLSDADSKIIVVTGSPPTAVFTWQPTTPLVGETVEFNAGNSLPNGGSIIEYTWDFGDGSPPTHSLLGRAYNVFATYGQFNVTLTVVDNEGLNDTVSNMLLAVAPPTADFTVSPAYPQAHETTTFDASASTPNGGTIVSYTWDFGDGNITTVGFPAISHIFIADGTYTVALTVTDTEGLSNSTSRTVGVSAATGPEAAFSHAPPSPHIFEAITFNASASTPGSGSITSYRWDFGDGNITTVAAPTVIHFYATSGNFTVVLTVTNTASLNDTEMRSLEVLPISGPTADFTWSPSTPKPNATVNFDASSSTSGWNGSTRPPIVSYTWDFGDGNITTTPTPTIEHVYSEEGTYTVTLTVHDVNGATANKADTITVAILVGDLNGDGKVDIKDIAIVAKAYGSLPGDSNWNPVADINGDGKVDIKDIAIVAKHYGETA